MYGVRLTNSLTNGGDIHLHSGQQTSQRPYPKGKPPKLLRQSGGVAPDAYNSESTGPDHPIVRLAAKFPDRLVLCPIRVARTSQLSGGAIRCRWKIRAG